MTRNDPGRRLLEIRGQLARLVATPRDTVFMFDIRYEGLRKLEANLIRKSEELGLRPWDPAPLASSSS